MTHRPSAITHTQEYRVLPRVVRHTFNIFGLFTTPNLCPRLTQNRGDATEGRWFNLGFGLRAGGVSAAPTPAAAVGVAPTPAGVFQLIPSHR